MSTIQHSDRPHGAAPLLALLPIPIGKSLAVLPSASALQASRSRRSERSGEFLVTVHPVTRSELAVPRHPLPVDFFVEPARRKRQGGVGAHVEVLALVEDREALRRAEVEQEEAAARRNLVKQRKKATTLLESHQGVLTGRARPLPAAPTPWEAVLRNVRRSAMHPDPSRMEAQMYSKRGQTDLEGTIVSSLSDDGHSAAMRGGSVDDLTGSIACYEGDTGQTSARLADNLTERSTSSHVNSIAATVERPHEMNAVFRPRLDAVLREEGTYRGLIEDVEDSRRRRYMDGLRAKSAHLQHEQHLAALGEIKLGEESRRREIERHHTRVMRELENWKQAIDDYGAQQHQEEEEQKREQNEENQQKGLLNKAEEERACEAWPAHLESQHQAEVAEDDERASIAEAEEQGRRERTAAWLERAEALGRRHIAGAPTQWHRTASSASSEASSAATVDDAPLGKGLGDAAEPLDDGAIRSSWGCVSPLSILSPSHSHQLPRGASSTSRGPRAESCGADSSLDRWPYTACVGGAPGSETAERRSIEEAFVAGMRPLEGEACRHHASNFAAALNLSLDEENTARTTLGLLEAEERAHIELHGASEMDSLHNEQQESAARTATNGSRCQRAIDSEGLVRESITAMEKSEWDSLQSMLHDELMLAGPSTAPMLAPSCFLRASVLATSSCCSTVTESEVNVGADDDDLITAARAAMRAQVDDIIAEECRARLALEENALMRLQWIAEERAGEIRRAHQEEQLVEQKHWQRRNREIHRSRLALDDDEVAQRAAIALGEANERSSLCEISRRVLNAQARTDVEGAEARERIEISGSDNITAKSGGTAVRRRSNGMAVHGASDGASWPLRDEGSDSCIVDGEECIEEAVQLFVWRAASTSELHLHRYDNRSCASSDREEEYAIRATPRRSSAAFMPLSGEVLGNRRDRSGSDSSGRPLRHTSSPPAHVAGSADQRHRSCLDDSPTALSNVSVDREMVLTTPPQPMERLVKRAALMSSPLEIDREDDSHMDRDYDSGVALTTDRSERRDCGMVITGRRQGLGRYPPLSPRAGRDRQLPKLSEAAERRALEQAFHIRWLEIQAAEDAAKEREAAQSRMDCHAGQFESPLWATVPQDEATRRECIEEQERAEYNVIVDRCAEDQISSREKELVRISDEEELSHARAALESVEEAEKEGRHQILHLESLTVRDLGEWQEELITIAHEAATRAARRSQRERDAARRMEHRKKIVAVMDREDTHRSLLMDLHAYERHNLFDLEQLSRGIVAGAAGSNQSSQGSV